MSDASILRLYSSSMWRNNWMVLLTVGNGNCCITVRLHVVLMSRRACVQPVAAIPEKRHRVLPAAVSEEHMGTGVPLGGKTRLILET